MFTAYFIDGPQAGKYFPIQDARDTIEIALLRKPPPLRLISPVKPSNHELIVYHLWPPVYGSICFYKIQPPPPMYGLLAHVLSEDELSNLNWPHSI
jgi:hypothetical protein